MNREEKNKFGNFVHEQRKKEEEVLEICQDIFANSRNELAVSMRYFQSALSALKIVPSGETQVLGTDGKLLYVSPQWLLPMFMQNKVVINRLYLHELLHCLFCHLWSRKEREWGEPLRFQRCKNRSVRFTCITSWKDMQGTSHSEVKRAESSIKVLSPAIPIW